MPDCGDVHLLSRIWGLSSSVIRHSTHSGGRIGHSETAVWDSTDHALRSEDEGPSPRAWLMSVAGLQCGAHRVLPFVICDGSNEGELHEDDLPDPDLVEVAVSGSAISSRLWVRISSG